MACLTEPGPTITYRLITKESVDNLQRQWTAGVNYIYYIYFGIRLHTYTISEDNVSVFTRSFEKAPLKSD